MSRADFHAVYAKDGVTRVWRVLDNRVPREGEYYRRNNGTVTVAPANTVKSPRNIVEEVPSAGLPTRDERENVDTPFNPVMRPKRHDDNRLLRVYDSEEAS